MYRTNILDNYICFIDIGYFLLVSSSLRYYSKKLDNSQKNYLE